MSTCQRCKGTGTVAARKPSTLWRGKTVATEPVMCGACRGAGVITPDLRQEGLMSEASKEITAYDTPTDAIQKYRHDWATLLPSHIDATQWTRLAVGALRRDKNLAQAAQKNTGSLLGALSNAARLGLEPGTEEFYLTPRKVKGQLEVLGIVGYQGIVEMMYRAGAISSVIAEVVYQGDTFHYRPGRDERPQHEIDWDAADRGPLRLVYAYAIMKDGATSKVVVLNRAAIETIKKSSMGSDSQWSPWQQHEAAMWLKSAVRQLGKWVPTSAEYRREQIRAVREVANEPTLTHSHLSQALATVPDQSGENIDQTTGEILDAELEPENGWPEVAKPGDDAA